jgi:hypothetical protein
MAQVKNNSSINITRTQFSSGQTINLGNRLFNGYVYSLSLDVGFDGNPSTLTLNLALNKTIKEAKNASSVQEQRKKDIAFLNNLNSSKNTQTTSKAQISNLSQVFQGTSNTISQQIIDKDFNIEDRYMGATTSYNITIVDGEGKKTYQLKNFKISSYSLSKRNNEKVLTVVFKDNAFVLDKIYVGVLGVEVAIDERSEIDAVVDQIRLNCPSVNGSKAGAVTKTNFIQKLHFAESKLAKKLNVDSENTQIVYDVSTGAARSNYIIVKSSDPLKQINNGYGAIILLGEEDFKDSICKASEVYYSFDSLIKAMKALGIKIMPSDAKAAITAGAAGSSGSSGQTVNPDSLKDKSSGQIKRKYSGTLKNVLAQWCDEYSYSYVVDFTDNTTSLYNEVRIKGIDLSDSVSKENVLQTKLEIENLESSDSSNFVIRSQEFDYDLSKKNLKLYSSLYFKDAKEQTIEYSRTLGERPLRNIKLYSLFPQLFGNPAASPPAYDFCGSTRTYDQVVISAILGKFSPKLREIYNYSIGAYQALGFLPLGGSKNSSTLAYLDNNSLIAYEAVTRALELQSELIFDDAGNILVDMNLGFYNESLANSVLAIESYIADFIGKHYWTDVQSVMDGVAGNEDVLMQYTVETSPATQKVFTNELYKLPIFQDARFLIQSIASLFNGTESYFKAFSEFNALKNNAENICSKATESYQKYLIDLSRLKQVRFYTARSDAAYGIFQELVRGLEYLDYSIGSTSDPLASSSQLIRINLAEAYAPIFKELSPVSLGVLQAALPIDVTNLPLGNYSFGVLLGYKNISSPSTLAANVEKVGQIFQFNFFPSQVFTNPIEYQNSIAERCSELQRIIYEGNINSLEVGKKDCNKTIFYSVCVLPQEQSKIERNNAAILKGLGPDPNKCQRIQIIRSMPSQAFLLAHVSKTLQANNGMLALESPSINTIRVQSARYPTPTQWTSVSKRQEMEYITLPSQVDYITTLKSKSNSQTFIPFRNFIRGGLEDKDDINKILNNDGFSLELDVNNITPNVRELYADATAPSFATNQIIGSEFGDGTPVVMNFQGYSQETQPKYEFDTFNSFHDKLKSYYDYKALSLLQPNVSYSADLFCSSISDDLKSMLSIENGLTKLSIALAENGLSIQCSFQSNPPRATNFQTLVYKNRPNIKLVNTNFLS